MTRAQQTSRRRWACRGHRDIWNQTHYRFKHEGWAAMLRAAHTGLISYSSHSTSFNNSRLISLRSAPRSDWPGRTCFLGAAWTLMEADVSSRLSCSLTVPLLRSGPETSGRGPSLSARSRRRKTNSGRDGVWSSAQLLNLSIWWGKDQCFQVLFSLGEN